MKKFRLFKALSIFAIAAAGAVAVGVGTKAPKVESAYADTAQSGAELFINASFWSGDNAKTQLYYMGGSSDATWGYGTNIGNNIYKFSVPEGVTAFIIVRKSKESTSWDDKWNQTENITFSNTYNYAKITNWGSTANNCQYTYNGFVKHFKSGDKVFADAENNFWYSDNAKSYFYTAFDDAGTNSWQEMSRVGLSNVSKYTFTSDVYCTVAVLVRGSQPNWDSKWNQTDDIHYTSENQTWNAFKLGANNGNVAVIGMEVFSDNYLVNSFAYYFLDSTQNYCSAEITNTSEIAGVLNSLSAEGTAVKSTFASSTISHTEGGHATYADNALSRYWNMTHESDHGKGSAYSDFLGLGLTFMSSSRGLSEITLFKSNDSASVILIVVISLASVSALAGLLFIRKRKHI